MAGSFRNSRLVDSGKSSNALFDGAKSVKSPFSPLRVVESPLVSRYCTNVVRFNTLATSIRFIAGEMKRKKIDKNVLVHSLVALLSFAEGSAI